MNGRSLGPGLPWPWVEFVERACVENCERNFRRIEYLLSPDTNNELKNSLALLKSLIDANFHAGEDRRFFVRGIRSGGSICHCIHHMH